MISKIRTILKLSLWELCLLSLPLPAFSQVGHGTVEALYYSREKIAVAADSRVTREGGEFSDTACKIVALGKQTLFFDTGIADFQLMPGVPVEPWDNDEEARRSFELESASSEPDVLTKTARRWGLTILGHLRDAYKILPDQMEKNSNPDGTLTDGFWAGVGEDGYLKVFRVHIYFEPEITAVLPGLRVIRAALSPVDLEWNAESVPVDLCAGIINNSICIKTVKADELRRWVVSLQRANPEHWAVLTAIHIVELTIAAGDVHMGLPADGIELTPKEGIRWEQRKPNCPAQ